MHDHIKIGDDELVRKHDPSYWIESFHELNISTNNDHLDQDDRIVQ